MKIWSKIKNRRLVSLDSSYRDTGEHGNTGISC
jgi:hypothetical protein